eukprot:c31585_g1_i1 orf=2-307(-)
MAGTTHQLWSLGLLKTSEEKDSLWERGPPQYSCDRGRGPAYPDLKHKVPKESLWIDGRHNPSCVDDDLRKRGPANMTQSKDVELCEKNENTIHDNAFPRKAE